MPKLRGVGAEGDGVYIPATAGVLLKSTCSPADAVAVLARGWVGTSVALVGEAWMVVKLVSVEQGAVKAGVGTVGWAAHSEI